MPILILAMKLWPPLMNKYRFMVLVLTGLTLAVSSAHAHPESHDTAPLVSEAHYLGNAGTMVINGETKLMFDPLFDHDYNTYQLVPSGIRAKMIAGTAPYDGVDVLFISHAHGDHFSAESVLEYLKAHPQVKLVAPKQAVEQLRAGLSANDFATRVISVDQTTDDSPLTLQAGTIIVEAVTIPHSGGERFAQVRNTVFRVHLTPDLRVLHLGDATIDAAPFAAKQTFWDARSNDLVFTPYWLFKDAERRVILDDHIRAKQAIGVHVPTDLSGLKERYGSALDDVDLFTKPGEVRVID